MIFTRSCVSAPVSACQCPGCRQQWWWVQYIPPARPLELASYLPPHLTSQHNLATDGAATHGIKWFSSIGQVWYKCCWWLVVFDAVCSGQPVPGDHGGYEDEQVDGRVHQGDLLQAQQEEGALHSALGQEEVSS